ncbi:MAG: FmdB family zinc ribbon protein [Candidatus Rifleibacteriota bacterium]
MPLYEFFCADCRKKFSVLCRISERDAKNVCQLCGSENTRRLVSRFKTIRSEEQLMENLADPSALSGIDENDPKSMAAWAKKMAREMGENMDDEIDAMAEEEFSGGGAGAEPQMPGSDDDQP